MLSTKSPCGVNCTSQKLGHTEHMALVPSGLLSADWWVWEKEKSSFSFPSLIGVQRSLPALILNEAVFCSEF